MHALANALALRLCLARAVPINSPALRAIGAPDAAGFAAQPGFVRVGMRAHVLAMAADRAATAESRDALCLLEAAQATPAKSERVTCGGGMPANRSPCHSHHALSFRALVLAGMIWMFSGTLSPQISGCVSGMM